ncbi:hypothetical protein O3P69_004283 [Scylla paramamosain]|uniref:Uncharacterized protein n=1 Tax=Scylla paramamosain TaxID=85552 RepID=A0AAW0UIM3_SCYPA
MQWVLRSLTSPRWLLNSEKTKECYSIRKTVRTYSSCCPSCPVPPHPNLACPATPCLRASTPGRWTDGRGYFKAQ